MYRVVWVGMIWFASVILQSAPAFGHDIVVVVLDDSGSMKDMMSTDRGRMSRMEAAKVALEKVIVKLPTDTQLGVLLLNGVPGNDRWLIPLSPIEPNSAVARIRSIRAGGGTPLGASMQRGLNELMQARAKQIYGNYRLLVVTDGEASDSSFLQAIMPLLFSRGVTIDVIGVAMKEKHTLASRAHSYRSASDGSGFEQALQEVFAESNTLTDDVGEDFEVIASLPEEFAREAIKALAADNSAVSLQAPLKSRSNRDSASSAQSPGQGMNTAPVANSNPAPKEPESGMQWMSTLFIAIFALWLITRKLTRTRRRKK